MTVSSISIWVHANSICMSERMSHVGSRCTFAWLSTNTKFSKTLIHSLGSRFLKSKNKEYDNSLRIKKNDYIFT